MIEINEWCPVCKDRIVSVSRGIPSMGVCAKGHRTDRRQLLRVDPEETDDENAKRLLVMLMNRYDLRPTDAGLLLADIDTMALNMLRREEGRVMTEAPRIHRSKANYPELWKAVEGGLKSAQDAHPEIIIPNTDSVVKRIVGQVLASGRSC